MHKWIRWWGLGLFAAITALCWLFTDVIVEKTIEFTGTQIVGAKVELDSAELSLSPAGLTLSGLQVTNPEEPMQNLLQSERIAFALDGIALLRRQFIAEEMTASGLQFYTERKSSGAIDGRLFGGSDDDEGKDSSFALPGLNLPDTDALVAEEKARVAAEISAAEAEIAAIEAGWQQRIDALPGDAELAAYKKRWDELKDANALQKLSGLRELKKDIDSDLDQLKGADEQLKTDTAKVKALSQRAASLPAEEAKRLLAGVGLDGGVDGMIRSLLGDEAATWLQRGISLYRASAGQLGGGSSAPKADEPAKAPRGQGLDVRFAEAQPLPDFLIKRASLDGIASIAGQPIAFAGELRDVTGEQALWGKPLTLKLAGSADSGAALNIDGLFDRRGERAADSLNFDLKQLALSALTLSDSAELPVQLQQGLANVSGKLALNGDALDANIDSLVRQAKLAVNAGDDASSSSKTLARALSAVSEFDLDLDIGGSLDKPELGMKSSLDKALGQALGAEFKAKVAEQQGELEQKLAAALGPELSALSGRGGALDGFGSAIGSRRDALKALLKQLGR